MFHIPAHKNVTHPAAQFAVKAEPRGPLLDKVLRYESGDMTPDEIIEFFRDGVESGWVWTLQGHYGRMAQGLIQQGQI